MTAPANQHCSRCGEPFQCGARLDACWCQHLPTLPAAAVNVAVDCVCPRCLAELIALTAPSPRHVV